MEILSLVQMTLVRVCHTNGRHDGDGLGHFPLSFPASGATGPCAGVSPSAPSVTHDTTGPAADVSPQSARRVYWRPFRRRTLSVQRKPPTVVELEQEASQDIILIVVAVSLGAAIIMAVEPAALSCERATSLRKSGCSIQVPNIKYYFQIMQTRERGKLKKTIQKNMEKYANCCAQIMENLSFNVIILPIFNI